MPEIIETEIGFIPKHWKVIPFNKVLKVKGRVGWKGYKTSDLRNEGPVVVGGTNIKANLYLDFSQTTYLSREKFEESPEIILQKEDVILVTRGNGIGDVGYYDGQFPEATINPSLVILSQFIGNSKYLFYYLNSPQGRFQVLSIEGGTSIPALYQGYINTLLCPIPPNDEQEFIVEILSSIDEKIDLLHRQNKTLEQLAETLFRQWFVEKANDRWERLPLSSIADFLNGLACQKFPPKNQIDKLPVLKIKELSDGITENSDWASTDIKQEYIVKNGEIIFAWSASLMVIIWNGKDCILNQHLFKVTSENFPKWFYYLWCKHHLAEFISISTSQATTMGHIKRSDLDKAMVLVPSEHELQKMNGTIKPLLDKIISNNNQIHTLTQLRDTLLPNLMSGEVRVNN